MYLLNGDPQRSAFNEWLKANGTYVAIAIAGVLLIVLITLLFINFKNKKKK